VRRYKTLFADDLPKQFEMFRDVTVDMLLKRGISFDPLHYARAVYQVRSAPDQSVEEFIEKAVAHNEPYNFLISDLNFTSGGMGGGAEDGSNALRLAKARWPEIKLILMTAHGRGIPPQKAIEIAERTGLRSAHWIDLSGYGIATWQNLATVCEVLCDLIDSEHLRKSSAPGGSPPS
jgi:hypothetical protein